MKVERCGIDMLEKNIQLLLPSVITIPIEKDGRKFVLYVASMNLFCNEPLQKISKEIADRLEIEPACG